MKKILIFIFLVILLTVANFSIIQSISAAQIPTRVNLEFVNQVTNNKKNGCITTLKATLIRTDTIKNVSGKPIKFFQDTLLKGTEKTNSQGAATIRIANLPGPHSAYAIFTGDTTYLASAESNIVQYACNLPVPPIIFHPKDGIAIRGVFFSYKMPKPKGGVNAPYYFQVGTFAEGAPPIGIILAPNGVLSGITKSPPGKYCFTVVAVDVAGNQGSARMCITVVQGLPNLVPFKPAGWADKIVVTNYQLRNYAKNSLAMKNGIADAIDNSPIGSEESSSETDSNEVESEIASSSNTYTFTTNDYLYVSKAVINDGIAPIEKDFYIYLYVDKSLRIKFKRSGGLLPDYFTYNLNAPLGRLKAGTHTIKIVADATKAIKESNEKDNSYAITVKIISVGSGQCTGMFSAPNACGPCSNDAQCSPNYCWTNNRPAPFC